MFEDLIDNKGKKENVVDKDNLIDAMKKAIKARDTIIKDMTKNIINLERELKYLQDL